MILAGIYMIFRIRLANLRRAKEELERKVEEATEEIRDKNEELEAQNSEIEAQRDIVMEQRDQISEQQEELQSSIRYASRIQTAVLPPEKVIDDLLDNYFILNKPRDIVSGDFYWVAEKEKHLFFTVADCTGHGVPGAFMSMLGTTAYYEVMNSCESYDSGKFLTSLREYIKKTLHHSGEEEDRYDGMDVAMCIIHPDRSKLCFTGANNPLYLIRNGELTEYKGNKMPIGKHFRDNIPFTSELIDIFEGDLIYMFSDGYPDQFGGEKGKKFKYQNLKDLLLEIHMEDLEKQKKILDETIEKWKGGKYEQIDDILVMGVKI
jgi:serine phosphatase RsbU (regulator of sigma subunit)